MINHLNLPIKLFFLWSEVLGKNLNNQMLSILQKAI